MVKVSEQNLRSEPRMASEAARRALVAAASRPLTGPRGGRYIAVGEPYSFRDGPDGDDWTRNEHTFIARVQARYVRPSQSARRTT